MTARTPRQPDQPKIFLLCLGAQKCGTSWLHEYLNDHPCADMGFAKEYHVFDALYVDECRRFLTDKINEGIELLQMGSFPSNEKTGVFKTLDFFQDTDNYFAYFWSLVNNRKEIRLTGDITPSYSALPNSALQLMKDKLSDRGFRVKAVFLMRDPVERCISAMRMNLRNSNTPVTERVEEEKLRTDYRSPQFELRARYDLTIANIESVFAAGDIHYQFYETLFTLPAIESLCDFLTIPAVAPNFDRRTNVSRTGNSIDMELRRE